MQHDLVRPPARSRPTARGRVVAPCAFVLALCCACLGNGSGNLSGDGDGTGIGGDAPSTGDGGGSFVGSSTPLESTTLHRLNASEYDNTVRDLLGTTQRFGPSFTPDEDANGFDNNASALTMTVSRLYDYESAAEALASELTSSTDGRLQKLAPCAKGAASADCVRAFVTGFGKRAWRRPLSSDEVGGVTSIATSNGGDTYAAQVQKAVVTLLVSPYFLYRVEDGDGVALNAYELATRLSYLLWSSTPDDALLAAAADGSLLAEGALSAQVDRLLADPRSAAFSANFGEQWLYLRKTQAFTADPNLFPRWNDGLRDSAIAQTEATFAALMGGNIALHQLFDGNTTYLNDDLAEFYGLPAPGSSKMVEVDAGTRRGLLTQSAVLAATSYFNRTSIVHRGVFLMTQLLCSPPPGAPPNIPSLDDADGANANLVTQRQRIQAHATSPQCAGCHSLIDPYGFALEAYDATGMLRSTDNGGAIDTTTKLTDGTRIDGVADMTAYFAKSAKVPDCFVQHFGTYAMGRTLVEADSRQVSALQAQFLSSGQRADKLVRAFVLSSLFRNR